MLKSKYINALAKPQYNLTACRLLIVEDDRTNAAILSECLIKAGYTSIHVAENGEKGLALMHEEKPDLIILDLMMPEMDGFEFCRHVRAYRMFDDIPVIVQTGLEDNAEKIRAFSLGASDYITKPVSGQELLARIKVHLTNKLLQNDISERNRQMVNELDAARIMQERLMPSPHHMEAIERQYSVEIAQHFEPSSIIGGDCWGVRPLTDLRMAFYMFDFSGHGVTAAINVFRMHTLIGELAQHHNDAGVMVTRLNRHLYPLLERGEFATMFYAIIDIEANCLEYVSASAPPVIICRSGNAEASFLDSSGFALGVVESANFETLYAPIISGDAMVMFSDCLIESQDSEGKIISEQEIAATIKEAMNETNSTHHAERILQRIISRFRHNRSGPVADDLTLNVYYRK